MMRKERGRDQTECWCDGWAADFHPVWNRTGPTNRRSPSCLSVSRCSLGPAAEVGERGVQREVRMERSDTAA